MALTIKPWIKPVEQRYADGNKRFVVSSLIAKAKDLPVQEMPIEHLNIYNLGLETKSMRELVSHIKAVMNADLDAPIILDDEGYCMDGRHRIAKTLYLGLDTIKFVRFDETPSPDYYESEDS